MERIYERCLLHELELRGIPAIRQQQVQIDYKGFIFEEELRFDLLVDGVLLLELKAVQDLLPIQTHPKIVMAMPPPIAPASDGMCRAPSWRVTM